MAWITAAQALEAMNVRAQTLYANVSRGRIRAKPDPKDSRRSLYFQEDVLRLSQRRGGRRNVATVAAQAIEWGDPVLSSAISTVAGGRLWYRGQDAVDLANTATLEEVAGLLWEEDTICVDPGHQSASMPATRRDAAGPLRAGLVALAMRCGTDLPSHGRSPAILRQDAADVFATLVHAMLGPPRARAQRSLGERIAATWRCSEAEDLIRRTLVLLADHELNASTFATRVTVSTGASLSAGVLAGLTTLTGPLHGGASASVKMLVDTAARIGTESAVREWLAQGRAFPAFGQPLYPDGDIRAVALLNEFAVPPAYADLSAWVERLAGERPNMDFALAALMAAYGLPAGAPLALFAIGRCTGWLAHALEQAATGHLIRPRARYVGSMPGATSPAAS